MTGTVGVAAADVDPRVAFARLVDGTLDRSYRIASVILGDAIEAEDATHDAVVLAWRSFASLRDPHRFDAWFQRILVNACRDRLRKRRRTPVTELDAAGGRMARDVLAGVDDRLVLDRAFTRLSPEQAITVALRFHADLTVDDIAIRMGVPAGTVKSRLHAALAVLERALTGAEVVDR
ncbi:MAG TPA: sigma-70 family RNA polymerase sigma factor [Candidatus Limnocylindrales bacterium]|jgi:RNA polymerase sigma-70 factor (ECF subfamily)